MQKRIPVGVCNYEKVMMDGYLFVDKTMFIERLEQFDNTNLLFLRPRKFGKSLFANILEYYYDINHKDKFEELFGEFYIGKSPTKLKNTYLTISFDFSGISTDNKDLFYKSFFEKVQRKIEYFFSRNKEILGNIEIDNVETVGGVLSELISKVKEKGKKLYVIIDEYDQFANDLMAMDKGATYKESIQAQGFVRDFYENLKEGTKTVIDRIFITGVSPVMLDDLTSGFNIATNISTVTKFNEMMGFTEEEVTEMMKQFDFIGGYTDKELLEELKKNYNGYKFSKKAKKTVYNSNMLLDFFSRWKEEGLYPENMVDKNAGMDRNRLKMLIRQEETKEIIKQIIKDGQISGTLEDRVQFEDMYKPEKFVTLLFYLGLITIKDEARGRLYFKIPNYVSQVVYWEYLREEEFTKQNIKIKNDQIADAVEKMAYDGEIDEFVKVVKEELYDVLSNRDLLYFEEIDLKLVVIMAMIKNRIYQIRSEMENSKSYSDLVFTRTGSIRDSAKYDWVIELKYIKKKEFEKDPNIRNKKIEEARAQITKQQNSRELKERDDVKYAIILFETGKDAYVEEIDINAK